MQSIPFGNRVRDYLRVVGSSQQDMAHALGLHPGVLGRKLRGTGNARLTQQEVKGIITTLADWRALSTQSEVLSLLELAHMSSRSLSDEEWHSPPLSDLDPDAAPLPSRDITSSPPSVSNPTPSLPSPMTRLIGRQWEQQRLTQLLSRDGVRLVTLVGPGGSGKTRLALEVATHLRHAFAHGVCWVALAGVRAPDLVPAHLLQTLGLRSSPGISALHTLVHFLRNQRLLLVLDNFEHLRTTASVVSALLDAAPGLTVLVTSREVLHLYGEYEFRVPPLALPDLHAISDPAELSQYEAIQLFVERVQAVLPTFTFTADMGSTIAQICISLDGLPLALELAAARVKLLSPAVLLHQLQTSRLSVLTQGARNVHPRQQTLRNTLRWSYDLLDPHEQQLFRRLAVFVGGFSLAAAEQVCAVQDESSGGKRRGMMDQLASLLDKSMLQRLEQEGEEESPRFRMLETLREYGLEQLRAQQEDAATWRSYTDYYVALAEEAEPHLYDSSQQTWVPLLTQEHENLVNALQWLLATSQGEAAVRLSSALWRFWWIRGLISEGATFLQQALAIEGASKLVRAKGLSASGFLTGQYDNPQHAEELLSESVALYRELGEAQALSNALRAQGYMVWSRGDYPLARALVEEALQLTRKRGDAQGIAETLLLRALLDMAQGLYAPAWAQAEEGIAFSTKIGNDMSYTSSQIVQALVAASQQDMARARLLVEEVLVRSIERNYPFNRTHGLALLGLIVLWQGDIATAETLFKE